MSESRQIGELLLEVYHRLYGRYGPQGWWPGGGLFETIVGAILTQNTAWANVDRALENLKAAGCLTPQAIRELPEPELAQLIRPSGYFNTKARKLKAMAAHLAAWDDDPERWRSRDAKELRAELLTIYGIGEETADDLVLYVAGLPSFVIDAYTRRTVQRLGLAPPRERYAAYQGLFEEHLPADAALFNEFHALLDRHAKETCLKQRPRCDGCCLLELCPTGRAQVAPTKAAESHHAP